MSSSRSESVWFSFKSNRNVEIRYLFDYIKKSQATRDDAGYELTIALKDKEFAEKNGIDQNYIVKCFATYISRDLIDPFPCRIVTTIPSSRPSNYHRAIDKVAEMVNDWHNKPSRPYLKRTIEIESAHLGGSRDRSTHERTIDAPYKGWIRGRHFLIIDDVATSCSSMEVCRQKLLDAGAASVECAVFSKTFDGYCDSKLSDTFKIRRSRAKSFLTLAKNDKKMRGKAKCASHSFSSPMMFQPMGQTVAEPDNVKGELLEIRKVGSDYRAFFSSGESIEVPLEWRGYLNGMLHDEIELGTTDITRGSQKVRVFYAKTELTESLNAGDFVRHTERGIGRVVKINEGSLTLLFAQDLSEQQMWIPCHQIYPASIVDFYLARYDAGDIKGSAGTLAKLFWGIDSEKSKKYFKEAIEAGDLNIVLSTAKSLDKKGGSKVDAAATYYEYAFSLGEREDSPFWLGRYYANRQEPDYEKAEKYYRVAIDCGDSYASPNNLAIIMERTDPEEAIRLYRIAIEAGNLTNAPSNLAGLLQDTNRDEAIRLYETAIENGNLDIAPKCLARLLIDIDEKRAIELYQISSNNGSADASYELAKLIAYSKPDEAKRLFESTLDSSHKANALEWLGYLNLDNPEIAKKYFKDAIDAGERYASPNYLSKLLDSSTEFDEYVRLLKMAVESGNTVEPAYNLGRILKERDVDEAAKYLKISADAGNPDACNEYALCIAGTDLATAKEYFSKAIELGDKKFAPYNLGRLIIDDDRDEGLKVLELAVENGNSSAMNTLALAIEPSDPAGCIELLEKAVLNGELTCAPINLAWRIRDFDRKRAVSLLQTCIGNNGANSAVDVLAEILLPEDVEEVIGEIEKAYDRGYMAAVFNIYGFNDCVPSSFVSRIPLSPTKDMNAMTLMAIGVFWLGQHTEAARKKAVQFFERAIDVGNESASACNLATILFKDDPARATQLYELALKDNQTEAKLGLGWLLEHDDPKRSEELLDDAYSSSDIGESLWFIAEYLRGVDPKQSKKLFNKAKEVGSKKAEYSLNRWFD